MKVLITGARGFIGSATVRYFKKKKVEVRTFEGDIGNASDWQKNLEGKEIIFLIAGVRTETDTDYAVNADSIDQLFRTTERVKKLPRKLILASTQAVYMGNDAPFTESQKLHPTTIYGKSKLKGERIASDWCKELDISLVVLRYSTVLGGGVREKSKMSGPLFVWTKAALANAPIGVFQDGNQTRDYIHIDNVVSANILAIDLPAGIYNVGGGGAVKLKDFANWVKEAAESDSQVVIRGGEPSLSDPREMFSDITKIKKYGWEPLKSPKQAVEEFVVSQKAS